MNVKLAMHEIPMVIRKGANTLANTVRKCFPFIIFQKEQNCILNEVNHISTITKIPPFQPFDNLEQWSHNMIILPIKIKHTL